MAEDITKRVDQLREDLTQQQAASMTLLGIVKGIDHKVDELTGAMRALQVSGTITEARINAMDARLSAVESRVNTLSQDVIASARQIESQMATKADLASLDGKLDQVISLLTQKPQP